MKRMTINAAFVFLSFLFLSISAMAQNSFFVGPMATGHLSNQEVSEDFADFSFLASDEYSLFTYGQDLDTKPLLGLSGGITFGFQFGRFSLVSGARFYQKGAKQESREFGLLEIFDETIPDLYYFDPYYSDSDNYIDIGTFKLTEKQNFIHVPLLARYQVLGEEVGFTLSLGPAFNIGIGKAKTEWDFKGEVIGETDEGVKEATYGKDLGDLYKPMQTSFIISPGVVFPVGDQGKLHLTLYWESPLSSSLNNSHNDIFELDGVKFTRDLDGDKRNKSFGIGISYEHHLEFNIGSKY